MTAAPGGWNQEPEWRCAMANNFKIFKHRTGESLHLKLSGDFDGSSASELLNLLKKEGDHCFNVFINTSDLNHVHFFGKNVIRSHAGIFSKADIRIHFIGKSIGLGAALN
jgi:hypothetical protein